LRVPDSVAPERLEEAMSSESTRSELPHAIERKLVSSARQSDRAMVVGNRAGVIEWANAAWTRVTGYPLDESIGKPVQSFLKNVEVDAGVVDFVARCFGQGKACEVEFPLTPPDRDAVWIQLRVEPLFDSSSEASDFLAIATDLTEQKRAEQGALAEVDLSELALRVARDQQHQLGDMIEFDFDLPANLPLVVADEGMLERFVSLAVARAAESVGKGWGTITFTSGILGESNRPMFRGSLEPCLPDGHWAFLEIHDTGCFPAGGSWSPVLEPFLSTLFPDRALRFAVAQDRLRVKGGELRAESSLSAGTSLLFLFRFAAEDSGWLDA
jgi:PAS domain S-box-containing protein